jgi:3-oxoacyl-[acyl-carrier protein] reductase
LITGSSRGIGRATALAAAAMGANVAVNYLSDKQSADEVVETAADHGGRAVAVQADVSRVDDIARLFQSAEAELGPLDFVVWNAAAITFGPIADADLTEFDRVVAMNLAGVFAGLQHAARRVRDGGRIITISSGATKFSGAGSGLYSATKAAGEQLTVVLAKELGSRGITVNSVSPGLTNTDGMVMPPEAVDQAVAQTPLGRLGEPADVADVIAYLLTNRARWVTGQRVNAGGGLL